MVRRPFCPSPGGIQRQKRVNPSIFQTIHPENNQPVFVEDQTAGGTIPLIVKLNNIFPRAATPKSGGNKSRSGFNSAFTRFAWSIPAANLRDRQEVLWQ